MHTKLNVLNTKEDAQSYVETPLLPTEPQDSTSSPKNTDNIIIPKHRVIVHPKPFLINQKALKWGK